jgi:hypothetical protein
VLLVPVDHEFAAQSVKGNVHVLKARVIESPVDAIEFGYPVTAGAAAAPETATSAKTTNAMTPRPFSLPASSPPEAESKRANGGCRSRP